MSLQQKYGKQNWQYLSQALVLELVLGEIKRKKRRKKKKGCDMEVVEVLITLEGYIHPRNQTSVKQVYFQS